MFVAFLEPQIQSAIDGLLPPPPTNIKRLEINESVKVSASSVMCIHKPCLKFDFYPISIAGLQLEIDSGEN